MRAERRFPVMGTSAHILVTGGDDTHLDLAQARIEHLEARWSRFRPDSELCALNRAAGAPTIVSPDTALLVARCVAAWQRTLGAFDPSVHDAMIDAGYDADFATLPSDLSPPIRATRPAPGLAGTVVDEARGLVWLRSGVHLDAGAIGKGLAADLVCAEVLAAGAAGVCVNLGGDLRVEGAPPEGDRWSISIEDPRSAGHELVRIGLARGAVATSSRLRRTWTQGSEPVHHVIDPRTGRPSTTATVAVTTIAREAWWAEVTATSALLADDPLTAPGVQTVVAVGEDGTVRATPDLEEVLACSPH